MTIRSPNGKESDVADNDAETIKAFLVESYESLEQISQGAGISYGDNNLQGL